MGRLLPSRLVWAASLSSICISTVVLYVPTSNEEWVQRFREPSRATHDRVCRVLIAFDKDGGSSVRY